MKIEDGRRLKKTKLKRIDVRIYRKMKARHEAKLIIFFGKIRETLSTIYILADVFQSVRNPHFNFFWLFRVPTCELCRAENPIKKCSKSHSRCKGKLFCNKNCEFGFHKREKEAKEEEAKTEDAPSKENEEEIRRKEELDAVAKAEKAKLKKAKKIANKDKSKGDGAFWWNNSVYASW